METPTFEKLPEAVNQLNHKLEAVLDLLKAQQPESHTPGKLLTISEAARYLNLSKPTLYRLTSQRQIPFSKPAGSKKLYFKLPDLEAWTQTGRKKTLTEIKAEASGFVKLADQRKNAKG